MKRIVELEIVKSLDGTKEYFLYSLIEVMKQQGIKITKSKLKKLGYTIYKKRFF